MLVAVGVDVVPSDDARERGRLREIGGGPASQELRQEVVVALHVVTVHAAWQRPAISVKCKCSVQVSIVVAGIDPGGFADQLEGSALEGPVRGPDAQGPLARRIVRAEISRAAELDAQDRTEGHPADHRFAVVVVQPIVHRRYALARVPEACVGCDDRRPIGAVAVKALRHVQFVVELR